MVGAETGTTDESAVAKASISPEGNGAREVEMGWSSIRDCPLLLMSLVSLLTSWEAVTTHEEEAAAD